MFRFLLFIFLIGCANPIFIPLMSGDCVDRAVIKRQELRQQGYESELVIGAIEYNGQIQSLGHCWVKYKDKQTGEWKQIYNY
jgi:hypothetical protein